MPGTGKSYALGAFALAWEAWAQVAYVTDPERFFGDPVYLTEMLLHPLAPKWRLVVLEDTGELFGHDARHEAGQRLSRMLNVTDGMLGQGCKAVFVVTTNEPMASLHEAVLRPGRCAAQVEFMPFELDEARKWLVDNDAAEAAKQLSTPATLAELYAMTRGDGPPRRARPVGFLA